MPLVNWRSTLPVPAAIVSGTNLSGSTLLSQSLPACTIRAPCVAQCDAGVHHVARGGLAQAGDALQIGFRLPLRFLARKVVLLDQRCGLRRLVVLAGAMDVQIRICLEGLSSPTRGGCKLFILGQLRRGRHAALVAGDSVGKIAVGFALLFACLLAATLVSDVRVKMRAGPCLVPIRLQALPAVVARRLCFDGCRVDRVGAGDEVWATDWKILSVLGAHVVESP